LKGVSLCPLLTGVGSEDKIVERVVHIGSSRVRDVNSTLLSIVSVDDSCLCTGGLAAHIGLRVKSRLTLIDILRMNRVNSCNDFVVITALEMLF